VIPPDNHNENISAPKHDDLIVSASNKVCIFIVLNFLVQYLFFFGWFVYANLFFLFIIQMMCFSIIGAISYFAIFLFTDE
jgi:hypothetical protein